MVGKVKVYHFKKIAMTNQKNLLQKLNKKQKETFIQYGLYVIIFFVIIFSHSFLRWKHYKDNTTMSSREIEVRISYDNVNNPDPNKIYFYRINRIKTVRAKKFMRVETVIKEVNLGTWSREKV